jgi:hypothetical protein
MSSEKLARAIHSAKQCIIATDDPRNWPDPGLEALKLIVAFIESQSEAQE